MSADPSGLGAGSVIDSQPSAKEPAPNPDTEPSVLEATVSSRKEL